METEPVALESTTKREKIYNDDKFHTFMQRRFESESSRIYYSSLIDRFIRYYNKLDYESIFKFLNGYENKSFSYKRAYESGGKQYTNTSPRKTAMMAYLEYMHEPKLMEEVKKIHASALAKNRNYQPRTFEMSSSDDIQKFKDFMNVFSHEEQLMLRCMWQTACRISGMTYLKVSDIKYDKNIDSYMLSLYKKGVGEEGYRRPISKQLYNELATLIKYKTLRENDFVFRSIKINENGVNKTDKKGRYLFESEQNFKFRLYTKLKNESRKVKLTGGIFGISHHYMRHARADNIYNTGIDGERKHDIMLVKEQLNHKSVLTTERYLNTSEKKAEEDTAELIKKQKNSLK